jgi:hypothetical protein
MTLITPPLTINSPPESHSMELQAEDKEQERSIPSSSDPENESNPAPEAKTTATPALEEHEWVSGIKLLAILTAITLVCFLVLLDTSIVVTVNTYKFTTFPQH